MWCGVPYSCVCMLGGGGKNEIGERENERERERQVERGEREIMREVGE